MSRPVIAAVLVGVGLGALFVGAAVLGHTAALRRWGSHWEGPMTAGAWTTHYQVCRGCGGTGELVTFTLREVRDFRGVERTAVVSTWQPCPDCKGTKWTVYFGPEE